MVRLTAALVRDAPSYPNACREREIFLRGLKIPYNECIDLTDNDISTLGNFPLCARMKTLLIARNRIAIIDDKFAASMPELKALSLGMNSIVELGDLEPLAKLKNLTMLELRNNPVSSKPNYRLWVISRCPSVRSIDYQRVTDAQRNEAKKLFGTRKEPTELALKIAKIKSRGSGRTLGTNGVNGTSHAEKDINVKMTAEERKKVKEMINTAKTDEEMRVLEEALSSGKLPPGLLQGKS
ncbi:L domain-like protein [Rhizodiscina lignyota]|uniref:U2 small nuclear ribonucleoprotein A' n=1 Tax=Rhizodiscina lignyota TaxID=1504668 RepID=A0A9P4IP77_9PEZI|nr:L domain-like protein [Rhizodiscina lignyota]